MKWGILASCLVLAGCFQKDENLDRSEIERLRATQADLTTRVDSLEDRLALLKEGQAANYAYIKSVADGHDSLVKTFNGNVNMENKAKVARMTAAGGCGQERINYPDGGWAFRNKECTIKDLRP